jgi:hypothetical protein
MAHALGVSDPRERNGSGNGRSGERCADLGEATEEPVDELRRLIGRQVRRDGDPLTDRDGRRDLDGVEHLEAPEPEDRPVDGRHPLQRPPVRVRPQLLVDVLAVREPALDERRRVLRQGRLGHGGGQPVAEQLGDVDPALLGLEEDVDGALARLGASSHLSSRGRGTSRRGCRP